MICTIFDGEHSEHSKRSYRLRRPSPLLLCFQHHQHFSSLCFYYNNKLSAKFVELCVCWSNASRHFVCCICMFSSKQPIPPSEMTKKELLFKFMINRIGLFSRYCFFVTLAFFSLLLHCAHVFYDQN